MLGVRRRLLMSTRRGWLPAARAVASEPALWPTALRQVRRLTGPGWWRRRPFLPVPPGAYLAFRAQTQYGDAHHALEPDDVVAYLRWCRRWDRLATG